MLQCSTLSHDLLCLHPILEGPFEFLLLCFQPYSLPMCVGRQQMMAAVVSRCLPWRRSNWSPCLLALAWASPNLCGSFWNELGDRRSLSFCFLFYKQKYQKMTLRCGNFLNDCKSFLGSYLIYYLKNTFIRQYLWETIFRMPWNAKTSGSQAPCIKWHSVCIECMYILLYIYI